MTRFGDTLALAVVAYCFVHSPVSATDEVLFSADGPFQPSYGTSVGTVDIRDSMHYEFDIVIHSFPDTHIWSNILFIGNRLPELHIDEEFNFIVGFRDGSGSGVWSSVTYGDGMLEAETTYHLEFDWDQDWIRGTINGVVAVNEACGAHAVLEDQTIYISNPSGGWGEADVSVSNILISEPSTTAAPTAAPTTEVLFSADGPIVAASKNAIGTVDIRDSMHFEMDFEIHSLPTDHKWRCPFNVESPSGAGVGIPRFFIDGPEEMMVLIVHDLGLVNTRLVYTKVSSVEAGGQYHVELDWSQDYFVATVNDVVTIEKAVGGHALAEGQTIWVGTASPGNVTLSNILISSTPSTTDPTTVPTADPTTVPTADPTTVPTADPTTVPTADPTTVPTADPTTVPTADPTTDPTTAPTADPTADPTTVPTADPTTTAAPTTSFVVTEEACSDETFIGTAEECEAAANFLGITWNSCCQNNDNLPYGCLKRSDNDIIWNGNAETDNQFPCTVAGNCDHGMRWAVCTEPTADPTAASHHYISRGYSNSGHFDGDVVSYCQDVDNNQAAYWSKRNDFDGNDFGYNIGVRCCKDEDDGTVTGYSPDCDAYPATYDDAVKVCTEDNDYRLCTREEMESDITKGTGCRFNHVYSWTSDECQSESGCDAASFTASGCTEGANCLLDNGRMSGTCCTSEFLCLEGEGDCDDDGDCAGSLVCGTNNCGSPFQDTHDCCVAEVSVNAAAAVSAGASIAEEANDTTSADNGSLDWMPTVIGALIGVVAIGAVVVFLMMMAKKGKRAAEEEETEMSEAVPEHVVPVPEMSTSSVAIPATTNGATVEV